MVAWISGQRPEDCFLSVVSIGEIERDIARKRSTDARFALQLASWLDLLLRLYADLLIAATALDRGLTVVTRNLRHFAPTGVPTFNPWTDEAPTTLPPG